ncbi:glycoside hydrolase family 3 protein [Patescibacteria group bacterium]|nr:glycoside hydrolase family 3 protein [Patescibacteria group bacterium]
MRRILFLLAGLATLAGFSFLVFPSEKMGDDEEELSLERAVGQVLLMGFEGTILTPKLEALMRKIQPGGVLLLERNIENAEQLSRLTTALQELSSVSLFIAVDQEGGEIARIPWVEDTAQAELKDAEHALIVGGKRAQELKRLGITMNLAPVLDSRDKNDFLFERSFRGDAQTVVELAEALYTSHEREGITSVPKHYPGYDDVVFNPEIGTIPRAATFPESMVFKEFLHNVMPSFLMLSHLFYDELDGENPLPLSSIGIIAIRERVGDRILLISDDLLSKSLLTFYPPEEIGALAMMAGIDVLLVAGYPDIDMVERFYEGFLERAKEDARLRERIFKSAARVLEIKGEFALP